MFELLKIDIERYLVYRGKKKRQWFSRLVFTISESELDIYQTIELFNLMHSKDHIDDLKKEYES
jgi:hypothetical protein